MKLKDPEECPHCRTVGRFRVVDSRRRRRGFRRKVHRCKECGQRWSVFLSVIDPERAWEAMTDAERRLYTAA